MILAPEHAEIGDTTDSHPPLAHVRSVDSVSTPYAITSYACTFIPYWDDELARKLARLQWLAFTRGNAWTEPRALRSSLHLRPVHRPHLQPGLRLARRAKANPAHRSMKTIRRQERKAMST